MKLEHDMMGNRWRNRKIVRLLTCPLLMAFFIQLLTACEPVPSATATIHPSAPTVIPTAFPTPTSSPSPTSLPSLTPSEIPRRTYVFYGDSSLAVGDAGDGKKHVGFSFVTNLGPMLAPSNTLITANYGGHTAQWGYEHLEEAVISHQPNVVTLWWGINDLDGCPGVFDRDTNKLLEYKVQALTEIHIQYLKLQIDTLLSHGIPVYLMTPLPVQMGQLPWTHLDENNNLVWEVNHWCNFNSALFSLVQAQRVLAAQYAAKGQNVYLVDVWQLYMDHPDTDKMYMDVVHPASNGAQLIAEAWLKVFEASQR